MKHLRGKILVLRGGAIGDFILTLPAIAALRRQFPESHLEVLGYPHIVQLAIAGGLVDRAEPIEARALAGFFARGGALEPNLADYFSEFDVIVSYLYDPDGIFRTNVARCSRAQFVVGPHRPDEKLGIHASKVYLKPLERLAIFDADPVPRLSLGSRGNEAGDQGALNQLSIHAGSGSERKNWPEESWAELLQHLVNLTNLDLLLIGGEAEEKSLTRLSEGLPDARRQIARSLPLPELARRLSQSAAFIGHDSGISHLAAAIGVPVLVLWGDTVEEIWRPPHDNVSVLRKSGGLKSISVEDVLVRLKHVLQAWPCWMD